MFYCWREAVHPAEITNLLTASVIHVMFYREQHAIICSLAYNYCKTYIIATQKTFVPFVFCPPPPPPQHPRRCCQYNSLFSLISVVLAVHKYTYHSTVTNDHYCKPTSL
jgi:hypothetical protein